MSGLHGVAFEPTAFKQEISAAKREPVLTLAHGTRIAYRQAMRWAGAMKGCVLTAILTNGCYRSASVDSNEIAQLRFDQSAPSAEVLKRNGERLVYAPYDSVVVKERETVPPRHWSLENHEFDAPVRAQWTASELSIQDRKTRRTLPTAAISEVKFYQYAPERPAIILLISGVPAVFVGSYLAAQIRKPSSDVDGRAIDALTAVSAAVLTFGVGLAITIPATSGMRVQVVHQTN